MEVEKERKERQGKRDWGMGVRGENNRQQESPTHGATDGATFLRRVRQW